MGNRSRLHRSMHARPREPVCPEVGGAPTPLVAWIHRTLQFRDVSLALALLCAPRVVHVVVLAAIEEEMTQGSERTTTGGMPDTCVAARKLLPLQCRCVALPRANADGRSGSPGSAAS